jgi:Hemolysins and related proteins containing CBS domains
MAYPNHLLITLVFFDIGINIGVQNCIATLVGDSASFLMTVGVPLALTLVLGEIIPKVIAIPYNVRIARLVTPIIFVSTKSFRPIFDWAISGINFIIQKMLVHQEGDFIQPQELKEVLRSCKDFGVVNHEESRLLFGYLSMEEGSIKERMKPKQEIVFYDVLTPIENLYRLFSGQRYSRILVCKDGLQNLLGVCSAKSLVLHKEQLQSSEDLLPLLRKPHYIPETVSAKTALYHLAKEDSGLGIIIDEYGSIEGLITQNDLFEIVSNEVSHIRPASKQFAHSDKNVIIAAGTYELSDFYDLFGVDLPTTSNCVTIGGWLTEQLGEIPETGTKFAWGQFVFQVLDAAPNCVKRVYIRKTHGN